MVLALFYEKNQQEVYARGHSYKGKNRRGKKKPWTWQKMVSYSIKTYAFQKT